MEPSIGKPGRWWVSLPILRRTILLGAKSLWLHRLRSLLTLLGIVFGVCSVIAMLAVGEGAGFEAQEQIRRQGSQNIIIHSVKVAENNTSPDRDFSMLQYGLTYKDLQRIERTVPTVDIVLPSRIVRRRVWNGGNDVDCEVVGTLPNYPAIRNHQVAAGRFFSERELNSFANVCVLGAEVLNGLFPREAAIDKSIRIGDDHYNVVGIMDEESVVSARGAGDAGDPNAQGAPLRIYIPLTAAKRRFGEAILDRSGSGVSLERVELHEIVVSVKDLDSVIETSLIIDDLLDRFHEKSDYTLTVPLQLLKAAEETKRIFNIVLGSIAGISLLVGGIGIMNIMLASVTERTREIGIRRALGAKRRDIVLQFLVETLILSTSGGVIGVALGFVLPGIISHLANVVTIVTFWSAVGAFSISACVGIIFGLYPAFRAANMDPVEALRHE
jgi:putative ABC transport system permease protein